ncbi:MULTISPECIES: NUDIX hydrolase [unclassified Facklamia]|uniref:NUDIX hydrolase n=1 Tax=Aerococcaceae TaxID=186827 RepID=UPI0013BB910C|nr:MULTISPECIES: NUDIX hydrolase [unclassified Facklamia]NEW64923.1 NUDIX domain-containing protein [Facklamia sp. 252]NEW68245.1 NUDIX domain-containing protein [Facklamia sp. 253]QQD66088.1 NUDIX hydrolase [Aerococcaceae bacterium zg-252]
MKTNRESILSQQDERLVSSNQIFDGHIMQLYVNQLRLDTGVIVEREIIHHLPAVCVLATDEDKVVLVKQYRPAIAREIYEIPAGLLDMEQGGLEASLVGAKRELEEETAYQAEQWREISTFYVSPGYLDEQITLFHATDLSKVENPLAQDENENVTVHKFTKQEIRMMIQSGEIIDLKTLFALQYWLGTTEKGDA